MKFGFEGFDVTVNRYSGPVFPQDFLAVRINLNKLNSFKSSYQILSGIRETTNATEQVDYFQLAISQLMTSCASCAWVWAWTWAGAVACCAAP